MSNPLFLGIDLGTSSLKSGLFDSAGKCVAFSRIPYPTLEVRGGSEQHAEAWWDALVNAVRAITKNVSPEHIAALAIGGHAPSPVFVDAMLEPVCAVLPWCDHRSKSQRNRLVAALGRNPESGSERLMLQIAARAMWLRSMQPDEYEKTKCILHSGDFLIARLTGRCVVTGSNSFEIFSAANLQVGLLPTIQVEAGEIVGEITCTAAERLGLPVSTPVITGGLDSYLASVGSGICEPGDSCISTGSSSIVALLSANKKIAARFQLGKYSLISQPIRLGGRILLQAQQYKGQNVPLAELISQAMDIPSPVLTQEILNQILQVTAPNVADEYSGFPESLLKLSSVELFRALLEVILLKQRQVLKENQDNNSSVVRVRSVGGLAEYPEFIQLQANVIGKNIEAPEILESGALGAAMLAAMAVGLCHDHKQAASQMTNLAKVYRPQKSIAACYDAMSQNMCFH